jgi:hypothetical protein
MAKSMHASGRECRSGICGSQEALQWRNLQYSTARVNGSTGSSIILAAFGMVTKYITILTPF